MLLAVVATLATLQNITWEPALPRQGSLIIVSAPNGVCGQLAGELLHFENGRAFAAIPLSATDSIELEVITQADGVIESSVVWIPVAPRAATGEKVRAAERFTPPPDSALLARINYERGLWLEAARQAHELPRLWTAPFVRPRSTRVTSPFGAGREVNGVWRSRHSGLDLSGRKGDPVRVSNSGVVALVGDFFYGGISIYVLHGAGLMTAYHHLSRALVATGDTVQRGQVIGRVGATGRVTGPHLHWGAQYGSISFDPADLLTLP